jgi:hypothetical protein
MKTPDNGISRRPAFVLSADTADFYGHIVATGDVVHRGSRIATAEGRLLDAEGKVLAHGTTTCLVIAPVS